MLALLIPGVGMGGGGTAVFAPIVVVPLIMEYRPTLELICACTNTLTLNMEP